MRGAAAVLRCIDGAPQDVASIAATLELHPNTVRKHLERLRQRGLVRDETERTGRPGRPRRLWHRTRRIPVRPCSDCPYKELA